MQSDPEPREVEVKRKWPKDNKDTGINRQEVWNSY